MDNESNYAKKKEWLNYALKLLNLAIETDSLEDFVVGNGIFSLKTKLEKGTEVNNFFVVLQIIYMKYKSDKSLELDKKLYDAIFNILNKTDNETDILTLLMMIEYQIHSEKTKFAPFELNCVCLLEELKKNLQRNRNKYIQSQKVKWILFEQHNRVLETKGHKIL